MDNGNNICANAKAECLSTRKCRCESTRKWLASTTGPKKNNVEKDQEVNSCAKREANLLELYEARVALQNQREREVKMYKLIVDDYVRISKKYLPPSVLRDWFGETGLLTLPGTGKSAQKNATSPNAGVGPQGNSPQNKEQSDSSETQTQQYYCSTCKETLNRNPTSRVAFLGDGNLVNGIMSNIYVAKIICRGCQGNKTMDLAGKHVLCFGCDVVQETL